MAKARNTGGGEIVLLVNQGSCPEKSFRMFSATKAGDVYWGCYFLSSTHVHTVFDDGRTMAYDFTGWVINPVYQRKNNQPL